MIRWVMCGVKPRDKQSCVELRQRLGIGDKLGLKVVQRNRLRWYGHVLRNGDDDKVKNCVTLKTERARQRCK